MQHKWLKTSYFYVESKTSSHIGSTQKRLIACLWCAAKKINKNKHSNDIFVPWVCLDDTEHKPFLKNPKKKLTETISDQNISSCKEGGSN